MAISAPHPAGAHLGLNARIPFLANGSEIYNLKRAHPSGDEIPGMYAFRDTM